MVRVVVMKITFEANLSVGNKKVLGIFLVVLIFLSASTIYLLNENWNLSSNLRTLTVDYAKLNDDHKMLQLSYSRLVEGRDQLYDKLNQTVTLERKYWTVRGTNITLLPRDTLAISIRLDSADEYAGIDGVDRLEITWVGIYGPTLRKDQVRSARVIQYFGGDDVAERWIGEKIIAFSGPQRMIVVPEPISNDTVVRESVNGVSFFFENYNYLGYSRPGNYVTVKLFYDGDVKLMIRELEIYVVGFVKLKLGEVEDFDSGWIGNKIEWEIRHWGGMT